VFRVQEWAEVHRWFHREKRSKAEIAAQLRTSRTTVYRLLALQEPPRYERERRRSLLDPHKAKIAELLATDAEAPAATGCRICSTGDLVVELRHHWILR
jgi:transposase